MIKSLELFNFRNYSKEQFEFSSKKIVFTGENGQGKTNILEAIYFLSILRSFRTSSIKTLTKINQSAFRIKSEINLNQNFNTIYEIEYSNRRILRIDGNSINKATQFIGGIKTIIFAPNDIQIVTASSIIRRRFINIYLSTLNPAYLNALSEYNTALKIRNNLLKKSSNLQEFIAFEEILAAKGAFLVNMRSETLKNLSDEINKIYLDIKNEENLFNLKYSPLTATCDKNTFLDKLVSDRQKDILKGYTSIGPHCDDFEFRLNGKALRHFGSTGQCRLASLCLKMASINLMKSLSKTTTMGKIIVLVDDVTGELDERTKHAFFNAINNSDQIFFTFTQTPHSDFFTNAEFFTINSGTSTKQHP